MNYVIYQMNKSVVVIESKGSKHYHGGMNLPYYTALIAL